MKINFIVNLILVLFVINLSASDKNTITGEIDSLYSNELDSDINFIIYDPQNVSKDEEVTIIFYIFGDFLFEPFSGLVYYLSNEHAMIPKSILVGINEISDKQIGQYPKEYADFITDQLMGYLSGNYSGINNSILFGHSRATRLVVRVIQNNSPDIRNFILSAPWLTDQQLSDLEQSFSKQSGKISIFITQSEEDMKRDVIRDSNENLMNTLTRKNSIIYAKYQYFNGETHMSIPPLSFYYGVKYLLE